jgi:hypothetical protein
MSRRNGSAGRAGHQSAVKALEGANVTEPVAGDELKSILGLYRLRYGIVYRKPLPVGRAAVV